MVYSRAEIKEKDQCLRQPQLYPLWYLMLANRPDLFLHVHHKFVILKSKIRCCDLCRLEISLNVDVYDLSLDGM